MAKIAIIEDDEPLRETISQMLADDKHYASGFCNIKSILEAIPNCNYDLIISDLKLTDGEALKLLEFLRQKSIDIPVIIITGFATIESAVDAIKMGAYDYLQKPVQWQKLKLLIKRALEEKALRQENEYLKLIASDSHRDYIWGPSEASKNLYREIRQIASSDSIVLITGPTGCGKEIVARTIHNLSPRSKKPFVAVNCAALSAGLLESELFGHEKGAFTGADQTRKGRFEIAEGGSILLDEISEIPVTLQAKLLRVMQFNEYERVGSNEVRKADVRIMATTNRDLQEAIKNGIFRQDLFYRLNVLRLEVPPLSARKEDIPYLVNYFLDKRAPTRKISVTQSAMRLLMQYEWPGNIRELENIIERAIVYCKANTIDETLISKWLSPSEPVSNDNNIVPLEEVVDQAILNALNFYGGNREKAAQALGITSRSIRNRLKKLKEAEKFSDH